MISLCPAVGDSGDDSNNITDTCEEEGKPDAGTANPTVSTFILFLFSLTAVLTVSSVCKYQPEVSV